MTKKQRDELRQVWESAPMGCHEMYLERDDLISLLDAADEAERFREVMKSLHDISCWRILPQQTTKVE